MARLLIWQIVAMALLLGLGFPVLFYKTLEYVYIQEQIETIGLVKKYVQDYFNGKKSVVSYIATEPFPDLQELLSLRTDSDRGVPEAAASAIRNRFQKVLGYNPVFRFISLVTADYFQPILVQPFTVQKQLSMADYHSGFAYRDWAKNTLMGFRDWNGTGAPSPMISAPFISQPGSIPALSISVALTDRNKKITAVLYVNMVLDSLGVFMRDLSVGKNQRIYLVDAAGNIIAHPVLSPARELVDESGNKTVYLRNLSSVPMVQNALEQKFSNGLYYIPEEQRYVLAVYEKIPELNWIVVLERDALDAFSFIKVYVLGLLILALVVCAVSVFSFRRIAQDSEASTRRAEELLIISETDPLTGLLNRRSMMSRSAGLIQEFETNGSGFVLAMFDIDDFKKINDTFGHVFGDVVLREISVRTVSVLRVEDLLFRWGGEEFLLIIRNSDLVRGRGVAEKIRRVIADTPFNDGVRSVAVTITIGVSLYHGGLIDRVILHADEALYAGKAMGKNVVVVSAE